MQSTAFPRVYSVALMYHHPILRLKGGSDHNAQTPSRQGLRGPRACEPGNPLKNLESA